MTKNKSSFLYVILLIECMTLIMLFVSDFQKAASRNSSIYPRHK